MIRSLAAIGCFFAIIVAVLYNIEQRNKSSVLIKNTGQEALTLKYSEK